MSILERQADFGRTLFEINQNTFQELFQSTQQNVAKYFELNSEFSQKLPIHPCRGTDFKRIRLGRFGVDAPLPGHLREDPSGDL